MIDSFIERTQVSRGDDTVFCLACLKLAAKSKSESKVAVMIRRSMR